MESSLISWLTLACSDVLHCSEASRYSLEECIIFAGRRLLNITGDTDVLTVHQLLVKKTSVYFHPQVMTNCVKLILKFVVSADCPEREDFVSQIISMNSTMQEHLMKAIQEESTDIPPDEDLNIIDQDAQESLVGFNCDLCVKKDKDIDNYTRELAHAVARETALEEQLHAESAAHLSRVMDLERDILEKDQLIRGLRSEVTSLRRAEEEGQAAAKERALLLQKISSLEDKIDVLEPLAQRSEVVSCQLERAKEKMDILGGLQDQLRAESAAHNQTHAQLAAAQHELEALRTSKTRLEEYRERCAESAIAVADLTQRLSVSEEARDLLSQELAVLKEGSQSSERMAKQLNDELLSASEALKASERTGGVGASMSELNPSVVKELRLLRTENADLRDRLDMSSMEALDKLQQQISDHQCVNSSLQQKWSEAKNTIAARNDRIAMLEAQERVMRLELQQLRGEHNETCAMTAEDRRSTLIAFNARLTHMTKRNRDGAVLSRIGASAVTNWLTDDLHIATETLLFTEAELKSTEQAKSTLEQQLHQTDEQLKLTNQTLVSLAEENKRTLEEVREEHLREVEGIVERGKRKIAEIEEVHSAALDLEVRKADSLAADIEDEKSKRRRVDREKRFYESEMQKYKSQLQVAAASGGGGGLEVEGAIKELKTMQDQLDASRAEVKRLKEQLSCLESLSTRGTSQPTPCGRPDNKAPVPTATSEAEGLESSTQLQHSFSRQPQRVRVASGRDVAASSCHAVASKNTDNISAYMEQTELLEKRIEQMTREKRELISKNLEENKEKMEMSQKLLQSEREHAALKAKMTKLTLEKERLERRIAKREEENVPPPPRRASGTLADL